MRSHGRLHGTKLHLLLQLRRVCFRIRQRRSECECAGRYRFIVQTSFSSIQGPAGFCNAARAAPYDVGDSATDRRGAPDRARNYRGWTVPRSSGSRCRVHGYSAQTTTQFLITIDDPFPYDVAPGVGPGRNPYRQLGATILQPGQYQLPDDTAASGLQWSASISTSSF